MRIDELKAQRIWVCFIIRKKDGGFDKKPISAYGTETGSDCGRWLQRYDLRQTGLEPSHGTGG